MLFALEEMEDPHGRMIMPFAKVRHTGSNEVTYMKYEELDPNVVHIFSPRLVTFQSEEEFEKHCKTAVPIIRRMLEEK